MTQPMTRTSDAPIRQTLKVLARQAIAILRDELQRCDVRAVIVGVYWEGGYRAIHLDPAQARELMRWLKVPPLDAAVAAREWER